MCSLPWTLTHPLFGFSEAVIMKTNNKTRSHFKEEPLTEVVLYCA